MFPANRKHFRLRFIRVMALIFLSVSSTQASTGPNSCAEVASAVMATDHITLVQDSNFIGNVAECIDEMIKVGSKLDKLQPIIQKLPELIEKALPVAKKGGMVLLSVYALYKSFELYDRAMNLEKDLMMYRERFEAIKEEMKHFKDFKVTQLIPQWEIGNAANLEKDMDMLLEMISRQSTRIWELFLDIHKESKTAESDKRWTAFYSVFAVAACGCSIAVGYIPVMVVTCGVGTVIVAFSAEVYVKNTNTITKLDMFIKDVISMRKEITKYRSQLNLANMKAIKCNGIDPQKRKDCGYFGIARKECEEIRGCCFDHTVSDVPCCFFGKSADICSVRPEDRKDCGWYGIDDKTCKDRDCCYDDTDFSFNTIFCFFPTAWLSSLSS